MITTAKKKNVFDAIIHDGHDQDFTPRIDSRFVPTDAPAGSPEKVEVLRKRAELGLPLWHRDDRLDYSGLAWAMRPLFAKVEQGRTCELEVAGNQGWEAEDSWPESNKAGEEQHSARGDGHGPGATEQTGGEMAGSAAARQQSADGRDVDGQASAAAQDVGNMADSNLVPSASSEDPACSDAIAGSSAVETNAHESKPRPPSESELSRIRAFQEYLGSYVSREDYQDMLSKLAGEGVDVAQYVQVKSP
jgi:hypothetical protein